MKQASPRGLLSEVFGFDSFRPHQEEIVRAILDRQDAFVVMPTGGGKSLCYQLPAVIMPGTCMVISPLISLMKDQVDAASAMGLRASFLNSSLDAATRRDVRAQLVGGELDLIYVSPERFAMEEFVADLRRVALSFVAIDEAHCVSEWGHDFRPDYLNLARIVKEFPDVPVAAFTATATHRVQDDIVSRLGLRAPHLVRASFNRPNLLYKVVPKQRIDDQLLKFVQRHPGEPGIIYRTTRKSVEGTATKLCAKGIRARPYHAGLDADVRSGNQEAFNRDDIDVIVATIAFGMGIDKSNVRFVLHADLPKNVEGYYQETGRAGRDGEPAACQLFFGYGDIPKLRFFIDQAEDEDEKRRATRCLNDMVHYATVYACRRKQLLNYFGEAWPVAQVSGDPDGEGDTASCCDICSGDVERIDATRDAQILMSAIARTGQRFGVTHIVDVVTGSDTERIRKLRHSDVKTYGAGSDKDKHHWRAVMDNLLAQGLVQQVGEQYPVLQLTEAARDVLFKGTPVFVLKTRAPTKRKKTVVSSFDGFDEDLFDVLRGLRKQLASAQGVPPYVVFNDRTLHEMAARAPANTSEFSTLGGVGETKLARYGEAFLKAIADYTGQSDDALSSVRGKES